MERHGLQLPPPMVVADSWFGDSKLMQHVHDVHQGIVLVEGKQPDAFTLANGQQVKGHDLIHGEGWRWQQHPREAGCLTCGCRGQAPPMAR